MTPSRSKLPGARPAGSATPSSRAAVPRRGAAPEAGGLAPEVRTELAREFWGLRPRAEAGQLAAAALLAAVFWPHAQWAAPAWLSALGLGVLLARRLRARQAAGDGRLRAARAGLAVTAGIWGVGLLLLVPDADPTARGTALLVVAGMLAALASTASADTASHRVFSAALLLGLLVPLLARPDRGSAASAVAVVVFGAVMESIRADLHRRMVESIEARWRLARREAASDAERRELTQLFERAPWGFAIVDVGSGRVRRSSRAFQELVGLTAQELAGRRLSDVMPVADAVDELPVERPDGSLAWLRIASEDVSGANGPARLLLCEDVTSRRLHEETQGRYRELVETASDVIWRIDLQGRWRFLNAAAARVYGVPIAELLGRSVLERVAPEEVECARAVLETMLAGEEIRDRETVHRHASGDPRFLSFSAWPERDAMGRIVGAQGIARDVTERVAAREAQVTLARERALLTSLIDASPDLVFVKDGASRYLWANTAFAAYVGRTTDQIPGSTDPELLGAERGEALQRSDREILAGSEPGRFEGWLEHPDGRRVLTETVLTPARSQNGEVVGLIGISRDMTERRRVEDELKRLAERAEHATRMKSEFLALMSHEIRTPLNGVVGMLELLLDSPLPDEQRHQAEVALGSAGALLALLGDILDFSRIEAGMLVVENESFDLRELLERVVALMATPAAGRGNRIHLDVQEALPRRVVGDLGRLRQVLTNLLSNASKFTERGEIWLSARMSPGATSPAVEISVKDTGIGIPADRMAAVFEPFTQADSSITRRFGGSGLGLAISRQLVTLMQGELVGRSTPGEGSVFSITLPLGASAPASASEGEPISDGPRSDSPVPAPLGPLQRSLSVLLVEDSPVNQRVARLMLEKRGHAVEVAGNGREALEAIARRRFDVALMDLQMPELDGLAATVQLRARGYNDLPVVALTAHAYAEERDRCAAAGMDDFLSKPFKMAGLVATVERWGSGRAQTGRYPRVDLELRPA